MIFIKLFYDNFWDNSPSFYLFVPKKKRGKDSFKSCPKNGSTNIISLNKSTAILYAKIQLQQLEVFNLECPEGVVSVEPLSSVRCVEDNIFKGFVAS